MNIYTFNLSLESKEDRRKRRTTTIAVESTSLFKAFGKAERTAAVKFKDEVVTACSSAHQPDGLKPAIKEMAKERGVSIKEVCQL